MNDKISTELAATYPTLREANLARQIEWDKGQDISLSYRGNEFAGEAGEVCNVIKKLERERLGLVGSRDTVEHLAEELADTVICADLIAADMGIDLDAAIEAKFNATSVKVGLRTRLLSLRNAQSEAVAWGNAASLARPLDEPYWERVVSAIRRENYDVPLYTHPAPPLAVTDEMVRNGARGIWDAGEVGAPFEMAPKAVADSLFKQSRAALTAALEAKQ